MKKLSQHEPNSLIGLRMSINFDPTVGKKKWKAQQKLEFPTLVRVCLVVDQRTNCYLDFVSALCVILV